MIRAPFTRGTRVAAMLAALALAWALGACGQKGPLKLPEPAKPADPAKAADPAKPADSAKPAEPK